MASTTILLVEDDEELAELVADYLRDSGFVVELVDDGALAEEAVRRCHPDLVILDLMLPNKDGLNICRDLRTWYTGPVLLLTARSGWVDEIVGLELGADDYLGKPVEPRLLLARVRTLLRRAEGATPLVNVKDASGLIIDEARRSARLNGAELELTDAEYDLLVFLRANTGRPLTRDDLSHELWQTDYDGLGRTIDVRIGRLRTKLGDDAKKPRWIKSVRGVGYMFVEPED